MQNCIIAYYVKGLLLYGIWQKKRNRKKKKQIFEAK